jgi:hypothetical protein
MSWILAHHFDIIKGLPKYIIRSKSQYNDLLMSLYNCENININLNTDINIIDILNNIFDEKEYYKKLDLQVFQINKQIYDYPKQITTTIDNINSNVLFYYNFPFSSEKISLIRFMEYCKNIKTHKLIAISGFNSDQQPIFIKKRNNIFLIYDSLHNCKILTNDLEIYPNMIYFKYYKKCDKEKIKSKKEVLVPVIIENGNVDDQLTNIALPSFYDIITKIYQVSFFDFKFQNEIKTFAKNFIIMCNKNIPLQQIYHPKQYYLSRTKSKK